MKTRLLMANPAVNLACSFALCIGRISVPEPISVAMIVIVWPAMIVIIWPTGPSKLFGSEQNGGGGD